MSGNLSIREFLNVTRHFVVCLAVIFVLPAAVSGCGGDDVSSIDWDQWESPSVEYRPWVRWWWPGNDVDEDEIVREVELLAANGFGGAELNSMSAALNWEPTEDEIARRFDWGSEKYWSRVRLAVETAAARGIFMDLNVGSGWPVGGSHVSVQDSMKTLLWSEVAVSGPARKTMEFTSPANDPFYEVAVLAETIGEPMARYLPDECVPVEVLAAKKIGGIRDPDVWNLTDQVELDRDSVLVLTDSLGEDGKLTWDVPAGDWIVIGFYSCPDGEYVNLNALADPKGAFVVNHFDSGRVEASNNELMGFNAGLQDLYGHGIRGMFVDSFELKTERHFADDFFDMFETRRGYDVRPWLPAVVAPGADNHIFDGAGIANECPFVFSDLDERVAYDYQVTVSDLFIERYVKTNVDWAAGNGMNFRIQPYGLLVDVMRAAGTADIPETEQLYAGGSELALKVVSSGAHQYGRNVVSAESLVSAGRDYMSTPTKIRAWLDKLFTAGINQVVYHGFPYKTGEARYGETDWHAFSSPYSGLGTYSENISEASPYWQYMDTINTYVARVQFLLRQGRPRADILVYYPYLGTPASVMALRDHEEVLYKGQFGDESASGQDSMLDLVQGMFGGFNPNDATWWMGASWPVLQSLEDMGYTWEWTNDDRLANARIENGRLFTGDGGGSYGAVVVMRAPWMSPEAAGNLADMAGQGLPVVVVGDAPAIQPGYLDHENGDAAVVAAFEQIAGIKNCAEVGIVETPSEIENGNPRLFTAEGLASALLSTGVVPAFDVTTRENTTRNIARDVDGGRLWFVRNPSDVDQEIQVTTDIGCEDGLLLDAMGGWVAPIDVASGGIVTVSIPAWTSRFILCGVNTPASLATRLEPAPFTGEISDTETLSEFSLTVIGDDVADGAFGVTENALGDWREIDQLKYTSSPGLYKAAFDSDFEKVWDVPDQDRTRVYLDLGTVYGAAEVSINGFGPYELISEPYRLDITDYLVSGKNDISVILVPPLRNRLVGLGIAGDPTAAQFDGKEETTVATGLVGPVTVETIVDAR